jgi:hypothetical protein
VTSRQLQSDPAQPLSSSWQDALSLGRTWATREASLSLVDDQRAFAARRGVRRHHDAARRGVRQHHVSQISEGVSMQNSSNHRCPHEVSVANANGGEDVGLLLYYYYYDDYYYDYEYYHYYYYDYDDDFHYDYHYFYAGNCYLL